MQYWSVVPSLRDGQAKAKCLKPNIDRQVRTHATIAARGRLLTAPQINEQAMATFVDGGGVPLDKYKRAASRVPLPLKFDDAAQVGSKQIESLHFSRVRVVPWPALHARM